MKIFLGSDHGGYEWKQKIFEYLAKNEYDAEDVGAKQLNPDDDYPQFAKQAALQVIGSQDDDPRAILICRGGQGMAIAANRHRGIRASVIWNAQEAKMTRMYCVCQQIIFHGRKSQGSSKPGFLPRSHKPRDTLEDCKKLTIFTQTHNERFDCSDCNRLQSAHLSRTT